MRIEASAPLAGASPQSAEGRETRASSKAPTEVVDVSAEARDRQLLDALKKRDLEVRQHEAAHAAVGGALAGAPSFTFERGPDGKSYAVGGEVSVELSAGGSPEETIARARQVRAAAMAPAQPSGQDYRVAAAASALELRASLERATQLREAQSQTTHKNVRAYAEAPAAAQPIVGIER